jgi:uncharacterized membrane protein YedE/YeeE
MGKCFEYFPIVNLLLNPWPWWISGPLIGLTVGLLLLFGARNLGTSSSFRHLCALTLPKSRLPYLSQDHFKQYSWNLIFVAGIALGSFIAVHFLSVHPVQFLPPSYHSFPGALKLIGGGFLVGFGTRWARGCTSGHAIMGLSNLQMPSLYAVLSFFAGGLCAAGVALLLSRGLL